MTIGVTLNQPINAGSEGKMEGLFALDNSYPTGGYPLVANQFIFGEINRLVVATFGGYLFQSVYSSASTVNLKVLSTSGASTTAQSQQTSSFVTALIPGMITGTVKTPYASITLLQATSTATATVSSYPVVGGNNVFVVNVTSGTFDATHVVTGTNSDSTTFTFIPQTTLIDVWTLTDPVGAFLNVQSQTGAILNLDLQAPSTGRYATISMTEIATLDSDGYTQLTISYLAPSSGGGINEVSNGTDLSALSAVPFEAYGF